MIAEGLALLRNDQILADYFAERVRQALRVALASRSGASAFGSWGP